MRLLYTKEKQLSDITREWVTIGPPRRQHGCAGLKGRGFGRG